MTERQNRYSRRKFLYKGMQRGKEIALATVIVPSAVVLFESCGGNSSEQKKPGRRAIKDVSGKIATLTLGEDLQLTLDDDENELKINDLDLGKGDASAPVKYRVRFRDQQKSKDQRIEDVYFGTIIETVNNGKEYQIPFFASPDIYNKLSTDRSHKGSTEVINNLHFRVAKIDITDPPNVVSLDPNRPAIYSVIPDVLEVINYSPPKE